MMTRELGREPERWVLHDLRHTIRTRMAALQVPENVAEMILGHAKKGMGRIYDEYQYEAELLAAYEQWAGLLRGLIAARAAA